MSQSPGEVIVVALIVLVQTPFPHALEIPLVIAFPRPRRRNKYLEARAATDLNKTHALTPPGMSSVQSVTDVQVHSRLITLRREIFALRNGEMVGVDTANPNLLSYVWTAPAGSHAVVVALNMTGPQKITVDLTEAGISQRAVRTLLTNDVSLQRTTSTSTSTTLSPFAN
jgi:hypothetical protein